MVREGWVAQEMHVKNYGRKAFVEYEKRDQGSNIYIHICIRVTSLKKLSLAEFSGE